MLGKTIAVLPSSIDEILPASHKRMAAQIIQSGGLLVSEYEPGMGMAKWHYVERNRIIAALSPATVVIEAPAGSGALITADFALEYGRDVMFHEIAFCENAQKVSHLVYTDLEKAHAKGTVSRYKLENTPEKYLEAGAQCAGGSTRAAEKYSQTGRVILRINYGNKESKNTSNVSNCRISSKGSYY